MAWKLGLSKDLQGGLGQTRFVWGFREGSDKVVEMFDTFWKSSSPHVARLGSFQILLAAKQASKPARHGILPLCLPLVCFWLQHVACSASLQLDDLLCRGP